MVTFSIRSISFIDKVLNVDELEWIYDVYLLKSNPLPFKGFDAHTTGPLAIYFLKISSILNSKINLVSIRIFGLTTCLIPTLLIILKNSEQKINFFASCVFTSLLLIYDKDFFSYNTEYLIIPLTTIMYFLSIKQKLNNYELAIYFLILFALPFIKFQALLFSLFFIFVFYLNTFFQKNYFALKVSILIFFIYSIAIFIGLFKLNIQSEFYNNYIYRNLFHANNFESKSIKFILIENLYKHINYFGPYYLIILLYTIPICKRIINNIKSENISKFRLITVIMNDNSRKTLIGFLFFFTSFVTILIPKTNNSHYFLLMFAPLTILISILLEKSILNLKILIVVIMFLNLNQITLINKLIYNYYSTGSIKHQIKYDFDEDLKINSQTNQLIKKIIPFKENVFFLGWYSSLTYFYSNKDNYYFTYNSGHTLHLTKVYNKKILETEQNNILKASKLNTNYIVDFENIITNQTMLRKHIKNNFYMFFKNKRITIYKRKNLN